MYTIKHAHTLTHSLHLLTLACFHDALRDYTAAHKNTAVVLFTLEAAAESAAAFAYMRFFT
jgi:hypothetical protein